ncbi:MAG: site-specific integrase, partial [Muribaculaceae bacterium]|nr:site-specific integrase [Muribaculaceae bacterium]
MSGVYSALQYTLPVCRETKNCTFIEFYAYDPEQGKMRRKRIKTNRIEGVIKRRQYIRDVIKRLSEQLSRGWNPWIAQDASNLFVFEEALCRYEAHIEKMLEGGYFRKETYDGYKSYVKIMREYISKKRPTYYVYQFDRKFCVDFLDFVFIERNNSAQTRNNYLNFLRVFAGFLVDKGYLQSKPTDGIAPISKRLFKKERTCIPLETVGKIADYCQEHDPHFLLACYLLYYCFIRPVEMTRLRVRDFDLKAGTVTIPAECSKNKKRQMITLPKKVIQYAVMLGVFSAPMSDFIFSDRLKPGRTEIDPKQFRDHWAKLRKPLKLRKEWKFYSLNDTGITAMLRDN